MSGFGGRSRGSQPISENPSERAGFRSRNMANLVVLLPSGSETYPLEKEEIFLGRLPECDIVLDSNMVSRKHARVFQQGGEYYIEDLGSGNGTTVNGERLTTKSILKHNDRIKFGPLLVRFEESNGSGTSGFLAATQVGGLDDASRLVRMAGENDDASRIMDSVLGANPLSTLRVRPEEKLKAVLEITRSLAGVADLQALLPKILDTLFNVFPQADRGCILLKDDVTAKLVPRAIKHRRADDDESVKLSRTILNKVLTEKTGILSADAANDARFNASESISNFTIRSMMCVPLLGLDGEPMGVINIDTQNPLSQFQKDDLDLLVAVASQAAMSYESARLMVTYMEKQKQDSEMGIARKVQRALLPEELPSCQGYEFFASYEAAQAVGGDYYGCFELDGGKRICLAFGDVAGKGVPAALVMSRLSSVVESTLQFVSDAGEAVKRINRHMCANAVEGRFVTFVLVMIDIRKNRVTLVNAGHMSPIIRHRDGSLEEFPETAVGLPIGVVDDFDYEVVDRDLQAGDVVVIYTDGVSEAMNPQNELFSIERIREIMTSQALPAAGLGKVILSEVKKHANGREQNDDITLMAFGRA